MNVACFTQTSAYKRGKECTQVYSHVKYSEGTIHTVIAFWIKLAHHGRNIWFKEPVSNDEECQPGPHHGYGRRALYSIRNRASAEEHKELAYCH